MSKRMLVVIIAVLFSACVAIAFAGCIPVTIRPQFDDQGAPIALPVTPTGTISPDGVITPIYPISTAKPTPHPSFPWETALAAILGALGVAGGGYGLLIRGVAQKAKTALRLACDLADANANVAEEAASLPPEESAKVIAQIQRNKNIAAQEQEALGVRALIQKVRKK